METLQDLMMKMNPSQVMKVLGNLDKDVVAKTISDLNKKQAAIPDAKTPPNQKRDHTAEEEKVFS